jgi:hypothetical protein
MEQHNVQRLVLGIEYCRTSCSTGVRRAGYAGLWTEVSSHVSYQESGKIVPRNSR